MLARCRQPEIERHAVQERRVGERRAARAEVVRHLEDEAVAAGLELVALEQRPVGAAVVKRFEALGVTPLKLGSADFAAFVAKHVNDWTPAIKAADVKN